MPKPLCRQMKECIASMIRFCEQERDSNTVIIPLTAVRERIAAMTNVNISTVTSIWQCLKTNTEISSPKRKRPRNKPVTTIDDATQISIRNTIYQMYEHHEHITLDILKNKLVEANIFSGCKSSLHVVLKTMGFKWIKNDPRRGLMELPHVIAQRLTFLRMYHQYKMEGRYQFVFLDETWIFQNGTIARSWQDKDLRTVKSTKVDGKRFIVVHAGNKNGFIPGAKLVFSSKTKESDYHGEMNQKLFLAWFTDLLNLLHEPSAIIMDNAPYHNALVSKVPNTASSKGEIEQWLAKNHIEYDNNSLKRELLSKVALYKLPKQYLADQLAEGTGHKVLRLPPYHCNFNAIELIWGISKNYYNRHIGRDGKSISACVDMWEEALNIVTAEQWANSIQHVEKAIGEWWNKEIGIDIMNVAPIIININNSSDSSDSESGI